MSARRSWLAFLLIVPLMLSASASSQQQPPEPEPELPAPQKAPEPEPEPVVVLEEPVTLEDPDGAFCGLGFELVFLVPPLMWLRWRRRLGTH